jgi:hypothetical protein
VASIFQEPTADAAHVSMNYVGVLKDILKLDYRLLHSPVILLRYEWFKQQDTWGNCTYTRDDAGFLVVNSRHKLPRLSDPFIFPSQVTQVFFSNVPDKLGWKVVLRKEARSRREVLNTSDVFISTTVESTGLIAPDEVLPPPQNPSLVGAIELSDAEHLQAIAKF